MTKCKDCKHFNQSDQHADYLGLCDFVLPKWVYRYLPTHNYDISRYVRVDDECSLGEKK